MVLFRNVSLSYVPDENLYRQYQLQVTSPANQWRRNGIAAHQDATQWIKAYIFPAISRK